jgi:hypothetical protein
LFATLRQVVHQADMGSAWQGNGLVFTSRTGRAVEPRNFVRSFRRSCGELGIRVITACPRRAGHPRGHTNHEQGSWPRH